MGNDELEREARKHLPQLFHSEFDRLKFWAQTLAHDLGAELTTQEQMKTMAPAIIEPLLQDYLEQKSLYPADLCGE
jgi:hypothetical protein